MTSSPDLEPLARRICEAEGFDPDEMVTVDVLDRLTEGEQVAWHSGTGPALVTVPRWMTYCSHAKKMAQQEPG